jgi:hypothetical protein
MKKIGFVSGVFAALLVAPLLAFAQTQQAGSPVALSDGAMAKVYDHCGEGDLCATIDYPNGDRLAFYSEGAAIGQPYVIHVVRTNVKGTEFEYSRGVDRLHHEQLTIDRGKVHLDIDYINDGTLRFSSNQIK